MYREFYIPGGLFGMSSINMVNIMTTPNLKDDHPWYPAGLCLLASLKLHKFAQVIQHMNIYPGIPTTIKRDKDGWFPYQCTHGI